MAIFDPIDSKVKFVKDNAFGFATDKSGNMGDVYFKSSDGLMPAIAHGDWPQLLGRVIIELDGQAVFIDCTPEPPSRGDDIVLLDIHTPNWGKKEKRAPRPSAGSWVYGDAWHEVMGKILDRSKEFRYGVHIYGPGETARQDEPKIYERRHGDDYSSRQGTYYTADYMIGARADSKPGDIQTVKIADSPVSLPEILEDKITFGEGTYGVYVVRKPGYLMTERNGRAEYYESNQSLYPALRSGRTTRDGIGPRTTSVGMLSTEERYPIVRGEELYVDALKCNLAKAKQDLLAKENIVKDFELAKQTIKVDVDKNGDGTLLFDKIEFIIEKRKIQLGSMGGVIYYGSAFDDNSDSDSSYESRSYDALGGHKLAELGAKNYLARAFAEVLAIHEFDVISQIDEAIIKCRKHLEWEVLFFMEYTYQPLEKALQIAGE